MWKKLVATLGICALGSVLALQATAEEGIGERIGEKVDKGLNNVVSGLQKEWAQVRQSVERMGVQGRVFGRLHWDKQLESCMLDVEIRDGNVAVLKGRVPSSAVRQHAIALARDTVGVNKVIDEMTLPPQQN
jgi:hypothetical protein